MYTGEEKLKTWLESQGFKFQENQFRYEYNECNWLAYRRSKLEARECESNDGKAMQIVVKPSSFIMNGIHSKSVEIELCGEANGIWWRIYAYAINPDELPNKLEIIERSLISSWNALCK